MAAAQSSASPRPRVALLTGANKGIGRAIAAGLLGESFVVYLGARDTGRGATATAAALSSRGDVRFVQLDVTSAESVDAAAARVSTDFGYLDVLVNNAVVSTGSGRHIDHIPRPTEETADDLRFVYETNVFAVVRVTNAFLPLLRRSPAGSSTSQQARLDRRGGRLGGPVGHGLLQLQDRTERPDRDYARELADTAIKVNGAAPGHVATDFNGFRGTRTPEQGAAVEVRLATLPADGPTGAVFEDDVQLAW